MSEWWIEFTGKCQIDADTKEEAIAKLLALNPHDGTVYDDELDINLIVCVDDA